IREKMEASPFGASVLSLIDSHLDNPNYGVEQISEDLGLSRIHLNRRLKAETDFSPSTVLKAVRMNQAVQLLMDGNHTIAEVASSCGFSTASYFSTAFKDYFGASPSDYMGSL
ncbi:MAG: helix-turn-helix transcriptional regulator, partial [Bacteroidales bacterium]|nr:helix-turn-helix transcriptional regulator [Bacteroidales bacterium]